MINVYPIYRSLSERVGVEFHGDSITFLFRSGKYKGHDYHTVPAVMVFHHLIVNVLTDPEKDNLHEYVEEFKEMKIVK